MPVSRAMSPNSMRAQNLVVDHTRYEFVRVLDYTRTPGGRYPADGPFPGSEFLEKFLVPAFERARSRDTDLLVDLDGTAGYASSFLEESFGGLARLYGREDVARRVHVKCDGQPYLAADVKQYIADAEG